MSRFRFVTYALFGALLIHVTLVACSSSPQFGQGPERAANAKAAGASTCQQWEVKPFYAQSYVNAEISYPGPEGKPVNVSRPGFEAFALPAGWEPFGGESFGAVLARHCAK